MSTSPEPPPAPTRTRNRPQLPLTTVNTRTRDRWLAQQPPYRARLHWWLANVGLLQPAPELESRAAEPTLHELPDQLPPLEAAVLASYAQEVVRLPASHQAILFGLLAGCYLDMKGVVGAFGSAGVRTEAQLLELLRARSFRTVWKPRTWRDQLQRDVEFVNRRLYRRVAVRLGLAADVVEAVLRQLDGDEPDEEDFGLRALREATTPPPDPLAKPPRLPAPGCCLPLPSPQEARRAAPGSLTPWAAPEARAAVAGASRAA